VGNEWIVIEGMHPNLPRIASRLPTIRAIATMFGNDSTNVDVPRALQPRIDILRIDADNLTCSVVARAAVPIDDERSLSAIRIVGAIETEEVTYAHLLAPPSAGGIQVRSTAAMPPPKKANDAGQGTVVLGDAPVQKSTLPFSAKNKFKIDDEATFHMDDESHHGESHKPATPFPAPGPKRASSLRRAVIPGAPWDPTRTANPPRVREETIADMTLAPVDEPTRKFVKPDISLFHEPPRPAAIPPAPVPVIPPAPVPVLANAPKAPSVVHTTPQASADAFPAPKPPEAPTSDMWAKTGNELPIVTAKAPPPRIPTKPGVNKAIYGGFGPPKKKV
jgi:hypothetical protein